MKLQHLILLLILACIANTAMGQTKVPSGKPIPAGPGVYQLERGGTYVQNLSPNSNTTYSYYGDMGKPRPVVRGNLVANGKSKIFLDRIQFIGAGKANVKGVSFLNCTGIRITSCVIQGWGFNGLCIEGYGGKRCSDVYVFDTLIADNWPANPKSHCEGLYFQNTDNYTFEGNVVDNNGGKPGTETMFNQGAYFHGSCGPGIVKNNVFSNNSSHGAQFRPGGEIRGNLFMDNAIGFSYGLVNGEACVPGGVSGVVENNIVLGSSEIGNSPRGWAAEFSNIKACAVRNLIATQDKQNFSTAIHVDNCKNLTNPGQMLPPSQWKLSIHAYVWEWPKGVLSVNAGNPTIVNRGFIPPRKPNLREELGAGYIPWARANPALAAPLAWTKTAAALGISN